MTADTNGFPVGLARLRALGEQRRQRGTTERCEFCGADVAGAHNHLVNLPQRALMCVCRPCYLLFTHEGAGGGRFRAVPDRVVALGGGAAICGAGNAAAGVGGSSDAPNEDGLAPWDELQVPVGIAFFFFNSERSRVVGFYPSPAGATESDLPLDAWQALVERHPALGCSMQPDVEALLMRRRGGWPALNSGPGGVDAFIVPIDVCYELVGRIRQAWHGFQGGDEAWRAVDGFFERIAARATREAAG